jgi:hypothetical protein
MAIMKKNRRLVGAIVGALALAGLATPSAQADVRPLDWNVCDRQVCFVAFGEARPDGYFAVHRATVYPAGGDLSGPANWRFDYYADTHPGPPSGRLVCGGSGTGGSCTYTWENLNYVYAKGNKICGSAVRDELGAEPVGVPCVIF